MTNTNDKNLKQRTLWTRLGYFFSATWITFILVKTEGNMHDPWFNSIFLVPLAVWGVGLLAARFIKGKPDPEKM